MGQIELSKTEAHFMSCLLKLSANYFVRHKQTRTEYQFWLPADTKKSGEITKITQELGLKFRGNAKPNVWLFVLPKM